MTELPPLKRILVPRFTSLARDKGLGGYHPTHVNFLHDHLVLQYMLKHASLFSLTHIKHFMVTQSNSYFNHPFLHWLCWPFSWLALPICFFRLLASFRLKLFESDSPTLEVYSRISIFSLSNSF